VVSKNLKKSILFVALIFLLINPPSVTANWWCDNIGWPCVGSYGDPPPPPEEVEGCEVDADCPFLDHVCDSNGIRYGASEDSHPLGVNTCSSKRCYNDQECQRGHICLGGRCMPDPENLVINIPNEGQTFEIKEPIDFEMENGGPLEVDEYLWDLGHWPNERNWVPGIYVRGSYPTPGEKIITARFSMPVYSFQYIDKQVTIRIIDPDATPIERHAQAPPQQSPIRCFDTDVNEEIPINVPGYVSAGPDQFEEDTCESSNRIIEKSCGRDGEIISAKQYCQQGYSCQTPPNNVGDYCSPNPIVEEPPSEFPLDLCPSNILGKNCGQFGTENACKGTFLNLGILCSNRDSDKIPCTNKYRIKNGGQGWGCYPYKAPKVEIDRGLEGKNEPPIIDDPQDISDNFCKDHPDNFLCLGLGYKQILELCETTPNSPICINLDSYLTPMENFCTSSPNSALCNGVDNLEEFCEKDSKDELCQMGLLIVNTCLEDNNKCLELTIEEKAWFCSNNSDLSFCERRVFRGEGLPKECKDSVFIELVGDSDEDGIADSNGCDRCIDTPEDLKGEVNEFGCAEGEREKRSSKKTCEDLGGIYCGSLSCPSYAVGYDSKINGDSLRDGGTCCIPLNEGVDLFCSAQVFNPLSGGFVSVTESACNDPDGDGIGTKTVTYDGSPATQEPCTTISAKAKNAPVPFFSNIHIIFTLLILGSFYFYKKAKKKPSLPKKENK